AGLMKSWRGYPPGGRRGVIEAMLRQPDRIAVFLDEVQAGRIKPGELDANRARQLTTHPRADLRKRAVALLRDALPADRKKVLEKYQSALKKKGDALRGRAVFQKHSSSSHRAPPLAHAAAPPTT